MVRLMSIRDGVLGTVLKNTEIEIARIRKSKNLNYQLSIDTCAGYVGRNAATQCPVTVTVFFLVGTADA